MNTKPYTRPLVLVFAAAVTIAFSALWLSPRERHVEMVLTGPVGARVAGVYYADGRRHDFQTTFPAKVSVDFLRTFAFTAEKDPHSADFTAVFESDFMKASATSRPSRPRVAASYYAPIRGFAKGGMSAEPR
jgi:hypothetical protein